MLNLNKDVAIPKSFFDNLTWYARRLHDSDNSDWNYLMIQVMKAAMEGNNCIGFWSSGDFFDNACVDIVKEYRDELIDHGFKVDIEENNFPDESSPFTVAKVFWGEED